MYLLQVQIMVESTCWLLASQLWECISLLFLTPHSSQYVDGYVLKGGKSF